MMQRVCVDRLPKGDRVTVFGDRESGAMRPQEKQRPVATLCLTFTEEIQTMSSDECLCFTFSPVSSPALQTENVKTAASPWSHKHRTWGRRCPIQQL